MASKKRDDGQGTIIQRANGTYQLKLRDGKKADGKPKFVYFSGKNPTECKRKLKEYQKKQAVMSSEMTEMTVDEYSNFFLYRVKYGTMKASSFDRLEKIFQCHIRTELGYMRMTDITTQHIQILINERAFPASDKKPLSRSSLKKIYEAVNMMFSYAVLREHIGKNPILGVVMPSEDNILVKEKEVKEIPQNELEKIIEVCKQKVKHEDRLKYRLGPLFVFLVNTGLRLGEALALELVDIDRHRKKVMINKTLTTIKERNEKKQPIRSKLSIHSPKTKKGIREVPLNDMALEALTLMEENNAKLKIESKYIFCSDKGTLINERNAFRAFDVILKNARTEHYGPHALRHTFASILLRKTKQIEIVSAILGHSNTSVTYNRYIHVLEEDKVKALENLMDIL